jgi:glucose-6-phosphate 1-epimerase
MSENLHCLPSGLPVVRLLAPDGASATVALHGGHVLSWVPAGGRECLYLSPRSGYAPGQAIRGGVPVIFPQFSDRGPLKRHGFARVVPWQLTQQSTADDAATALLRLGDSAQTRAFWPHAFALELTVRVGGDSLSIALRCRNTGDAEFSFQAALHSYFRVDALARCWLAGLDDRPYLDALTQAGQRQAGDIAFGRGDLDRVYAGPSPGPLRLSQAGDGSRPERQLQISQQGFDDVVVWNPGADKCAALADMPPDGWQHMVCVEAARIHAPVCLAPAQAWCGTQQLRSIATAA